MPQTGQQIITIQIWPNISRSKGNQTMIFGQLIRCEISFFRNEKRILVPDLIYFLQKLYIR